MTPNQQTKFSDEVTTGELLSLMVILYRISLDKDTVALSRFVATCSRIMGPDDFNKLLRAVIKMIGNDVSSSDWVMTKLYEIYTSYGDL